MWRITAYDKDNREVTHIEVDTGEVTIGRDTDRQLILPSAAVSRRHAKLVLSGPQPFIADEGSANGVLVNGVRISGPTAVVPGVRVDIAEFHLEFEAGERMTEAVAPIDDRMPPHPAMMDEDVVRLVAQGGPFDGRIYEIPPTDQSVGRAVDNELVLDDPSLSRKHARIRRAGVGRIEIEDLGSSNGTYVNGRKVGKGQAGPGDTVRFGDLIFKIHGAHGEGTRASSIGGGGGSSTGLIVGVAVAAVVVVGAVVAVLFLKKPAGPDKEQLARVAQQVQTYIAQGKKDLASQSWTTAENDFTNAIALDPANSEAKKLKALAVAEPDNQSLSKRIDDKLDQNNRLGFESALRYFDKLPTESSFRAPAQEKISKKLVSFGEGLCKTRKYPDCAWALCKAYEVGGDDDKPGADAATALAEAEKKIKDKSYQRCKFNH